MQLKRYFPVVFLLFLLLTACAPTAAEVVVSATPVEETVEVIPEEESQSIPFSLAFYAHSTLDPSWSEYRTNLIISSLLYEGLFQLTENFSAQPLLCTSYTTSGDGLVWTFTLRDDVTFSDGTPLTGELVAQSLSASADSGSRYATRLSSVTKFSGEGNILTLTLSSPNYALPTLLDIPITLPQEDDPLLPLGTGIYIYSAEDSSLVPREDYWLPSAVQEESITLHTIHYVDDLVSSFDAGYVSLVDVDLMSTQAPYFSSSYEVWDYATSSMIYLAFNMQSAESYDGKTSYISPCGSLQLRHAISLAVDRATIVDLYFAKHAVATPLPLHPSSSIYDVLLAATGDYSTALLASAVEDLTPLDTPLQLITSNENSGKYATASFIVDSLNAAGISTQLVSLSWDDYVVALETGDYDIYLAEALLTADFDLTPLLQTDGSLNYGEYSSPTTDELLQSLRSASSSAAVTTASSQLYTHLLEQSPIVPICFKNGSVLTHWGQISQLTPTQSTPFYQMNRWIFSSDS